MPNFASDTQIEAALKGVRDQSSFINKLLVETLQWPIDDEIESIEDLSYSWTQEELRAEGLEEHVVDGQIWQIQPIVANQPWGIFLLEFRHPDAIVSGHGMVGPLRKVLRRLVPNRRKSPDVASWQREHLLFLCTYNYEHFRVAYFKAPLEQSNTAPLAAFAWGPNIPSRTACEFNLPALTWPESTTDTTTWVSQWASAFDVEKVTKKFYQDYAAAFGDVERLIGDACRFDTPEDLRMFTQTLFNRLMFLRFIERKGWLDFDENHEYLRALFDAGGLSGKSLYQSRIRPLFFEALAVEGKQESDAVGRVPFLNGGLFEQNDLDRRAMDVPDNALSPMIGPTGLFYRYNFTIEESTPLDIEVAVDPEMLGKVFEELVTGRHESGSYYTPRPVVSFMCREALKGYLTDKASASTDAVARLVDDHIVEGLRETHARESLDALDNLKAVDPACGSGAYLLGLLHELVAIYRSLYSERLVRDERSHYELKLRIISRNLYGVDIDGFATNIAMLRLWLSLAVEADSPVALPNLDFKIETGDSLLAPDPQRVESLFRSHLRSEADDLVSLKRSFFDAHGKVKEDYRQKIKQIEAQLASDLRHEVGENVVDWRIQFAEAFANGRNGFDVVVANPPYVRKEHIPQNAKPTLREHYSDATTSQSDLYCYFYARGLELLRNGGMHVFVCSNSWLDVGYGMKLQSHLLQHAYVQAIINSAVERQFSTADINTIISVLTKGSPPSDALTRFVSLQAPFVEAIRDRKKRREHTISRVDLSNAGSVQNHTTGRVDYVGTKWGGRFLRAPEIYWVIEEKCSGKVVKLADVAEVVGYIHDNNTGGGHRKRPFLKSVKDAQTIRMTPGSPGVIPFGVKRDGNSSLLAPILFPRTFGSRHLVVWNPEGIYGKEFYKVIPILEESAAILAAQLNSTFAIFQRELLGMTNLGDGAIKFAANDVGLFEVFPSLTGERLLEAFEQLSVRSLLPIELELQQPDRRALDAVLFDAMGLTEGERDRFYDATRKLVEGRTAKAQSLRRR